MLLWDAFSACIKGDKFQKILYSLATKGEFIHNHCISVYTTQVYTHLLGFSLCSSRVGGNPDTNSCGPLLVCLHDHLQFVLIHKCVADDLPTLPVNLPDVNLSKFPQWWPSGIEGNSRPVLP